MKVAVVGAGMMGAASAFYLARGGADVHLFDLAPGPAQGVTRHAFGWINTVNGDPRSESAYRLRLEAVEEYRSVLSNMPELATDLRRGSLVWGATPELTQSVASRHQPYGDVEVIPTDAVAREEPNLKRLPPQAIYSPQDLALNPLALASAFIARAKHKGTTLHFAQRIVHLRCDGQSVQGVQTETDLLRFDLVVLAAGGQTEALLRPLGIDLGLQVSPAVLLRFRTKQRLLNNVLSFPELEARQATDGTVLVVENFHAGCQEESFSTLRKRAGAALGEHFTLPDDLAFEGGAVGQRPMFPDGLPRRGFSKDVRGLYYLVGHPGVILAPLFGRLAAGEIRSHGS